MRAPPSSGVPARARLAPATLAERPGRQRQAAQDEPPTRDLAPAFLQHAGEGVRVGQGRRSLWFEERDARQWTQQTLEPGAACKSGLNRSTTCLDRTNRDKTCADIVNK